MVYPFHGVLLSQDIGHAFADNDPKTRGGN
jgi:hypothetical protein